MNCGFKPVIQTDVIRLTFLSRFLDKAAVVEEQEKNTTINEQKHDPWRLATVTKVEEVKLIVNTIPIWLTSLAFGLCLAQPSTFFVKQAATMNLNITNHFKIPPASVYAVGAIGMIVTVTVYDRILVPFMRKSTGNERGLNILQRIGFGMVLSVVAMAVAAMVERKRQAAAGRQDRMSVFWLAPQFVIFGVGDGFALVGLQEYFYEQVPDSMRSLGLALYLSVLGVGSFLSSLLISVVNQVTEKNGRSWIGKDLSTSRLDNLYWLLAAISAVNLCLYTVVARSYTYKNVDRDKVVAVVHRHELEQV